MIAEVLSFAIVKNADTNPVSLVKDLGAVIVA
jgi:hypothetical protein